MPEHFKAHFGPPEHSVVSNIINSLIICSSIFHTCFFEALSRSSKFEVRSFFVCSEDTQGTQSPGAKSHPTKRARLLTPRSQIQNKNATTAQALHAPIDMRNLGSDAEREGNGSHGG